MLHVVHMSARSTLVSYTAIRRVYIGDRPCRFFGKCDVISLINVLSI